jgi:hypothetical protein
MITNSMSIINTQIIAAYSKNYSHLMACNSNSLAVADNAAFEALATRKYESSALGRSRDAAAWRNLKEVRQ